MNSINKYINISYLLYLFLLFVSISCVKDKIDFDKFSGDIEINPEIAAPLIKGNIFFKDFIDEDENTELNLDAEPIILYLEIDTVFAFDINDMAYIPDQIPIAYDFTYSGPDISPAVLAGFGDELKMEDPPVNVPAINTIYAFTMEEDMKLDSIYLNGGNLVTNSTNNFDHPVDLIISSDNIIQNGQIFIDTIRIDANSSSYYTADLSNSVMRFNNTADTTTLNVQFSAIIYRQNGQGIANGDDLSFTLNFDNLNYFDAAFGYVGNRTFDFNEEFETGLDELGGLEGVFILQDPQIILNYTNSFGIEMGFSTRLVGLFEDDSVELNPPMQDIEGTANYGDTEINDSIVYDRSILPGIDGLIGLPAPSQIVFRGQLVTNPNPMPDTVNFATNESSILMSAKIVIPFELRADLTYTDTVPFEIEEDITVPEVEFFNLHYWFKNQLPIGLDASLILYDSINDIILDTIHLSETADVMFIEPSPVLADGKADTANAEFIHGIVSLDNEQSELLLNEADHIILKIRLRTTELTSSVKILSSYKLWFKFGIHAKGKVFINSDD